MSDDVGSELDARVRRAAASLRSAVAVALDDGESHVRRDGEAVGHDEGQLVDLARGRADAARRSPKVRATALVLVVASLLLTAALVLRVDDDTPAPVATGPSGYFLPSSLPAGFELQTAQRWHPGEAVPPSTRPVTVYGTVDADDLGDGPTLAVRVRAAGVDPLPDPTARRVEVEGRSVALSRSGTATVARVDVDGTHIEVAGRGLDDDAVAFAAAHASSAGAIAPRGLPDDLAEVMQVPVQEGSWFPLAVGDQGLQLVYGGPSSSDGVIALMQEPPGSGAAMGGRGLDPVTSLMRVAPGEPRVLTIGGQPAVVTTMDAISETEHGTMPGVVMRWHDDAGGLVTIVGNDIEEHVAVAFAESLQPARASEVDALLKSHGQSPPLGAPVEGETVVARDRIPTEWQLVASDDGDSYGLAYHDINGSTGVGFPKDASITSIEPSVAGHGDEQPGDEVAIFGLMPPETVWLTVESPAHEPFGLSVHAVDGWPAKVFVGWWPVGLHDAELIAVGPDGEELARVAQPSVP